MKQVYKRLLDWIYPRRCALCDDVLGRKERYLCKTCRTQIPVPPGEPRCKKCGKPIPSEVIEYCTDCAKREQQYDQGMGVFLYEGAIKKSILRLKSGERKEYGEFLGKLMSVYGSSFLKRIQPDLIVPVPLHKNKRRSRGYNQAELLAIQISRGFSIPLRTDLVLRKKITKEQKKLGKHERQKNLRRVFQVKKEIGNYRRVLIVDDIYTTGSTVNAVAEKMKQAGVLEVFFITLCIGKGF